MPAGKEGQESPSSKRTLSESSAEDVGHTETQSNGDGMWRNELSMNADSSSAQPEKHRERSPCPSHSNRRLSDAVDVVLRIVLVLTFL